MNSEKLSKEFEFLRDKLKEAATCLYRGEISHAAWILGTLHTICHYHHTDLNEVMDKEQEHKE